MKSEGGMMNDRLLKTLHFNDMTKAEQTMFVELTAQGLEQYSADDKINEVLTCIENYGGWKNLTDIQKEIVMDFVIEEFPFKIWYFILKSKFVDVLNDKEKEYLIDRIENLSQIGNFVQIFLGLNGFSLPQRKIIMNAVKKVGPEESSSIVSFVSECGGWNVFSEPEKDMVIEKVKEFPNLIQYFVNTCGGWIAFNEKHKQQLQAKLSN